jgi:hypothetical protein
MKYIMLLHISEGVCDTLERRELFNPENGDGMF